MHGCVVCAWFNPGSLFEQLLLYMASVVQPFTLASASSVEASKDASAPPATAPAAAANGDGGSGSTSQELCGVV